MDNFEHPGPRKPLTRAKQFEVWWLWMPDSFRRAIRTFAQGFLGVYVLHAVDAGGVTDLAASDAWESALVAGVVAVVTYAHNLLDGSKYGPDTR